VLAEQIADPIFIALVARHGLCPQKYVRLLPHAAATNRRRTGAFALRHVETATADKSAVKINRMQPSSNGPWTRPSRPHKSEIADHNERVLTNDERAGDDQGAQENGRSVSFENGSGIGCRRADGFGQSAENRRIIFQSATSRLLSLLVKSAAKHPLCRQEKGPSRPGYPVAALASSKR